jgi:hypothetical protein
MTPISGTDMRTSQRALSLKARAKYRTARTEYALIMRMKYAHDYAHELVAHEIAVHGWCAQERSANR